MFLSEWREFPSAPCLAGGKKKMTARVSMLLKSRASLTCFRTCFLRGRAKALSAPRYMLTSSYEQERNMAEVEIMLRTELERRTSPTNFLQIVTP